MFIVKTGEILAGIASDVSAEVECRHANDYAKFRGRLPQDRPTILAAINRFLALPEPERQAIHRLPDSI